MVCRKPFSGKFGCGQCTPCLLRRRNFKVSRGLLESFLHLDNSFVTLTYEQGFLPEGGNLSRGDWQEFMKRLISLAGFPIRILGCGEYGELWRPHYHAILYGFPTCYSPPGPNVKRVKECDCPPCTMIQRAWYWSKTIRSVRHVKGFSDLRRCERKSIQYVCGYVTERKTKKYLDSIGVPLVPEFPIFSNRPGIGHGAVEKLALALTTDQGASEILKLGDVPGVVRVASKIHRLDRYMRFKLRQYLGFPQRRTLRGSLNNSPADTALRDSHRKYEERLLFEVQKPGVDFDSFKKAERLQQVLNVTNKHNIFSKRGALDGSL